MLTKILIKSNSTSGTAPRPDELSYAELAINTADGHLYAKKTNNTIVNLTSWTQLHNKPASFPPSSHSHTPSDISGTAVITSDPRLSDARTPLAHSHGNLTNTGRVTATRLVSESHNIVVTNDIGDLFKIDQISSNKVSPTLDDNNSISEDIQDLSNMIDTLQNAASNYVLITDSRLSDARVPLPHTHTITNSNVVIGTNSLNNISSGQDNTSVGVDSLFNNTTGINNTSVGKGSLFTNIVGLNNSSVGTYALFSNISSTNCAFGIAALTANTTGYENVAVGPAALPSNTTGIDNTAIGLYAGGNNTTGSYNTVVGANAGMISSSLNDCIVIGVGATATTNGDLVIGSSGHPINISSSVGSTGSAALLPARPLGYLALRLNGTLVKIPYYRA